MQIAPEKNTSTPETVGIGNIAISCSGGGYRASAFHLGSLDLLEKIGLLNQVKMLSTVSGGSITGAKYACALSESVSENKPDFYESFYQELYKFLLETRLPDLWFDKLHPEDTDKPSLIAAAAEVYNERLFKNCRFNQLIDTQNQTHLQETVFNTTELRNGLDFRFRVGDGGTIGNYFTPIPQELLKQVRIADVVAGSSCFPGGFEPIVFPDDFKLNQNWETVKTQVKLGLKQDIINKPKYQGFINKTLECIDSFTEEPLPLVDGGIYDNFGMDSLFVADARLKRKGKEDKRFDTLIISDTDNIGISTDTDDINKRASLLKLSLPMEGNWLTRITVKQLGNTIQFSFLLLLLSTIGFILSSINSFMSEETITFGGILTIWAAIIFTVITLIFGTINGLFKSATKIPEADSNGFLASVQSIIFDWNSFLKTIGNLSIVDLINMIGLRLLSFSSLFLALLKGQRRQSYEFLDELQKTDKISRTLQQKYGELEELEDCKKLNVVNNFVLETIPRSRNYWQKKHNCSLPSYLTPSAAMEQISIDAAQTPTTLWFDEDPTIAQQELDTVIACGQFTMCFTVLRLIEEMNQRPNTTISFQTQQIYEKAQKAWSLFQENPQIWAGDSRQQALKNWNISKN